MERKTICDGLRKHFWSAASASAHLRLLPLLVAACCAWLPAAQAEGAGNTAEPSTPHAVDAALAEAGGRGSLGGTRWRPRPDSRPGTGLGFTGARRPVASGLTCTQ